MQTHPTREAIERLAPNLRPFTLKKGGETFALPNGTALRVLGAETVRKPMTGQDGSVLVLVPGTTGSVDVKAGDYAGVVLLRSETAAERSEAGVPDDFASRRVVQGLTPETRDAQGRNVVYPIADSALPVPVLVTD